MSNSNNKATIKKIMEHPDKDEILSKLLIDIDCKDIHEWLDAKYQAANEKKFILTEKSLESFKDDYLDIYAMVQEDLVKTKANLSQGGTDDLSVSIQNLPAYKTVMLKAANEELDIRQMIKNLCFAIETRLAQVFDEIQEDPRNINTKIDRLLKDYADTLGVLIEKYYKFTEEPAITAVQHNVTLQVVDQHITVFHDVIKEVLSSMDLEKSMYFMEVFNSKMSKLKMPEKDAIAPAGARLAEAKLLNETISKKLDE